MHLALLVGYALGLTLLGVWIGTRVHKTSAFFVAGRRLSPTLIFATVLAANIGAGSTVGAAGLGYRDGVAAWWWVGSAAIGTLVLALWVGPRIWRVAAAHDLYTVGDYLEHRYGRSVRAIIASLLWVGTLAILAGQLIAVAWILDVVAGVPKWLGCVIGGGVMTIYFTAGGLLTSAWVNLVQLAVLLVGFGLALPWALLDAGGWGAVAAARAGASYFDFWGSGESGVIYLALLAPAFIVSPGLLQKVYGARDERAIRVGLGAAALALMLFAAIPPALGMIARVHAGALANPELALPTVLMVALPAWLGALGLAAVFSAEISSADAILFMLSTSLSQDLYKRFLRPAAGDREVLAVARAAAVAGGGLGVALAIVLPSVIGSLTVFYALLSVSLFVPVIAGLYSHRPGTPEALLAIAGGMGMLVVARFTPVGATFSSAATALALGASAAAFGLGVAARGRKVSGVASDA